MAGDSPATAVQAFTQPIQDALSCFLTGKVTADTYEPRDTVGVLTLNRYKRVDLLGRCGLSVDVLMHYRIIEHDDPDKGPWKVTTTGWMHHLYNGDGLVAGYHWHPISDSHIVSPHLHIGGSKMHFPSGRVLLEDVLALAQEHGAEPRDATRWQEIRDRNLEMFRRGATWGHAAGC